MINVWILVLWFGTCDGSNCPIEDYVITYKPTKYSCEADLRIWMREDDHNGMCLWGVLEEG